MFFGKRAGMQYVDRGNPVVTDFVLADFIVDNTYHTLTLPNFVPINAKGVYLALYIKGSVVGESLSVEPYGYTNHYSKHNVKIMTANVSIQVSVLVSLTESRKIQYMLTDNGWTAVEIQILGWWI